jgi:hypothetical protein
LTLHSKPSMLSGNSNLLPASMSKSSFSKEAFV